MPPPYSAMERRTHRTITTILQPLSLASPTLTCANCWTSDFSKIRTGPGFPGPVVREGACYSDLVLDRVSTAWAAASESWSSDISPRPGEVAPAPSPVPAKVSQAAW